MQRMMPDPNSARNERYWRLQSTQEKTLFTLDNPPPTKCPQHSTVSRSGQGRTIFSLAREPRNRHNHGRKRDRRRYTRRGWLRTVIRNAHSKSPARWRGSKQINFTFTTYPGGVDIDDGEEAPGMPLLLAPGWICVKW